MATHTLSPDAPASAPPNTRSNIIPFPVGGRRKAETPATPPGIRERPFRELAYLLGVGEKFDALSAGRAHGGAVL